MRGLQKTRAKVAAAGSAAIALAIGCGALGMGSGSAATVYGTASHPFNAADTFNQPVSGGTHTAVAGMLAANPVAALYQFGAPIYTDVTASTPRYQVPCTEPWGTCDFDGRGIPIPNDAVVSPGSDGTLGIIDPGAHLLYSFWGASRTPNGWETKWAAIQDLRSWDDTTISGGLTTTDSGISAIAGVVTLNDVASGHIDHALAFSSSLACSTFIMPAKKSDGTAPGPNCIPSGGQIRLDPAIDLASIPGITPLELMIGRALQTYGAYCVNSGGASLAFAFQAPTASSNPYPGLGAPGDYWNMPSIPWGSLLVT